MKKKSDLEHENLILRRIATDLHWMARRYADGRFSYATGLFNDRTRVLLGLGVKLNPTANEKIWAYDGMGHRYDGLSKEDLELEKTYSSESGK